MPDEPTGLSDMARAAAPLLPPGDGATASLGNERRAQQRAAAARGGQYPAALADQLRARRIPSEGLDEARRRFTRPEDGLSVERLIGTSDLVPINYLAFGLMAAKPVCRIQIRRPNGAATGFGTGALVAPNLLITNNHVLPNAAMAQRSLAEFDFEDDITFTPKVSRLFRLLPEQLFVTHRDLDFTLVAVAPTANDGTPLANYGYLRLLADPGKLIKGEYVALIQHPDGNAKQAALRENQVIWADDSFIHYETDTQPGSSGAPVFNDQWFMVALHHSGVPRTDGQGRWLKRDGTPWRDTDADDEVDWIANEGVRVSRIFTALAEAGTTEARAALARITEAGADGTMLPIAAPATATPAPIAAGDGGALLERAKIVRPPAADAAKYADRQGHREDFLGADHRVPLPPLSPGFEVLPYANFTVVFDRRRRLATYTIVDVDGPTWRSIRRRRPDTWSFDPRLPAEEQAGPNLYDGTRYDYGHLVRRQDACSGNTPELGERDTFHLTNASPQDNLLNTGPWNDLENHVLNTIQRSHAKVVVITGPVLRETDPIEFGYQIPQDFYKIVAYRNEAGALAAAGWVQKQPPARHRLEGRAPQFIGRFPAWQVPIAMISQMTGLDFGPLVAADALASPRGLEAAGGFLAVPIGSPDDLIL
jgi:endonuclease G